MSSKPTLYGFTVSPPVLSVLLTLKALDLDFNFVEVNTFTGENKTAEYLKKNPQHTVPTLEDEGKYIWDSHAICAYLVRKYGKDDSLYPKDFYKRAVVDQRLHYENGVMFTTCTRQTMGPIIRGEAKKEDITAMLKLLNETYDMLEKFLADEPYFAGSNLTIADLSMVTTVSSWAFLTPIAADKHPKLAAWFDRMKALPYYEEANGKHVMAGVELLKDKLAKLLELTNE